MKAAAVSPSSTSKKQAYVSPYLVTLIIFIIFVSVLYIQTSRCLIIEETLHESVIPEYQIKHENKLPFALRESSKESSCDLFSGKWIRDDVYRPLYEEDECPYIQPQLTCQAQGRPDKEYQFWRWQPNECNLPSFNATLMLETLRGKRMMFVGDSLNRGQFVSLVCLLQSAIPNGEKSMETNGSFHIFRAKRYNATIEFYWAPFLLESNSDNEANHRISNRVVRKGSINKHGKHWKGADIIVFNTYIWWLTGLHMKVLQAPSFEDEATQEVELTTEEAYALGIKSMLRWVKRNMDSKTTRVFFTTMSPTHGKSADWGGEAGGNCYGETEMITNQTYWGTDCRKSIMQVVKDVIRKSSVAITLLNITQLSSYRKDAHTSIYKKQWTPLTTEQLENPVSYADCVHYCLPGLQDTWNELLFAKLFYP